MVRYSIGYVWQINGGVLPGLTNEDRPATILYYNLQQDRLCSGCASNIYEVWMFEQGEQSAYDLPQDLVNELGDDAVWSHLEVPCGYQVLRAEGRVYCDKCGEEI